jgi:UDP-N-acetylmuramyl pentapeptide phosphotransferase/UDP-N-acetylglucosamine-1-phosphate transferase
VRTTYISGVLTSFVEECVKYLFWHHDRRRRPQPETKKDLAGPTPSMAGIVFLAGIWLGYAIGGLLGALSESHWHLYCLAAPICCLLLATLSDLTCPLAALVPRE